MKKYLTYILVVASWLFCQCGSNHNDDDGGSDYPSEETFIAIDSCMSYMNSDPDKAHTMLDSLKEEGLVTKMRCDYYHAMIVFCGENKLDSALMICDRLLDENKFGDDRYLEEEICVLASNITSSNARHLATLRYANRGIAICHGNEKMRGDEATLMGRVGVAEQGLGRIEQARETYDRASKLLDENSSFADFVSLISLQRKKAGLCREAKDYDGLINICHDILNKVERFDRDPSFVKQRPETMKESGEATHDFAKFYKKQMYAHIAHAFRLKIESGQSEDVQRDKDFVNMYIEKWSSVEEEHAPDDLVFILPELYYVGEKALLEEAKKAAETLYKGDSVVVEYVDFLELMAVEAADRHDYKASAAYLQRAAVVNDSIRQRDLARVLAEQMSINMVQEEQLARQDAEYELKRHKLIILLLTVMLVVMIAASIVIVVLVRQNQESKKIIMVEQQELSESKVEIMGLVKKLENAKKEKVVINTKALYDQIKIAMNYGKLYLNPELDVKTLAESVGSSRSVVSACINSLTGKSFRQWLSEYRLEMFEQMLRENLKVPIDQLMVLCGYKDQSTFRRQFKIKYGMTVREYKKKIMEELGVVNNDYDDEEDDEIQSEIRGEEESQSEGERIAEEVNDDTQSSSS